MSLFLKWGSTSGLSIAIALCLAHRAVAQSAPPPGVTIPPTAPNTIERTIPKPSEAPRLPSETPTSPPRLQLPTPPVQNRPEAPRSSGCSAVALCANRFLIKKIKVQGSTVLQPEIAALTQRYQNREITFEDLLELRSQVVQLYIKNGYITSGAFLPNNQDLSTGIVQIQVVEGELEQIEIGGLRRLREGYVRSRLDRAAKTPLNQRRLEETLQLLQLDPLIEQVNAELVAGSTPGRNILRVSLKEAPALHGAIAIENNQSPSIGSVQGSINLSHDNLLGFGDRLSAQYGRTGGLNLYDINYAIPVNARNGTLSLRYNNGNSRIIEQDFRDIGITSDTQTYSLNLRQPLSRTPTSEFAISLGLDLRRSQTYILNDIPFSFTEGAENGASKVTVIRLAQDWVDRGSRRVLAARSQFSLGIGAFDATTNDSGTDGRFFSWLGQFQWVQQLSDRNLLVARIDAQLTPDSLLSLERFSIGGVDTVRGYRQNQLVADNGVLGSIEVRLPLTSDPRVLQLVPFFEVGTAWNDQESDPSPATIASLGLGLRWSMTPNLAVRLDYGIPLVSVSNRGSSLQENGFYFSVRYQPF